MNNSHVANDSELIGTAVAKMLAQNSTVLELETHANDVIAKYIACGLRNNKTLKLVTVNAGSNVLSDDVSAKILSSADSSKLEYLNIQSLDAQFIRRLKDSTRKWSLSKHCCFMEFDKILCCKCKGIVSAITLSTVVIDLDAVCIILLVERLPAQCLT